MTKLAPTYESWCVAQLGDLFAILDNRREPVNAVQRSNRQGDIPYYGATGRVGSIDDYLFDEELLLLGEDGAPFLQGDKSKAYVIKGKSWVNNHAHVLRALGDTPTLFWKYQLDQVKYRPFVSGTTRLKLSQAPMRRIPLLVPPLPEQHRIVDAIESYFTRLDDTVRTLKRVQHNLNRLRASVLKAAIEGQLVATEAELARSEGREYEAAPQLLRRLLSEDRRLQETGGRQKYQEPPTLNPRELPELPTGWCWTTVAAIGAVQLGQQRSPAKAVATVQHPYIRAANITWAGIDVSNIKTMGFDHPERYLLQPGDVLLSEASGSPMEAGKPAVWRGEVAGACFQNTVVRVRSKQPHCVLPDFLRLLFLSMCWTGRFAKLAPGVGIVHIGADRLASTAIPLAPVDEQRRIVDELERIFSELDADHRSVADAARRCSRLRQAVLKLAFEGRLADQDRHDEPANVLVERIQTEAARRSPRAATSVAAKRLGRGKGRRATNRR